MHSSTFLPKTHLQLLKQESLVCKGELLQPICEELTIGSSDDENTGLSCMLHLVIICDLFISVISLVILWPSRISPKFISGSSICSSGP